VEDGQEAERALSDAVAFWRLGPGVGAAASDLIDAATQALVDGLDSPTLRELAGESPRESWFVLSPMVERTLEELGIPDLLAKAPERAALEVMVRRFQAGSVNAHSLVCWAHQNIGHYGGPECQPFVDLDDMYEVADYVGYTEEELERWTAEEAEAFLAGQPSPGSGNWRATGGSAPTRARPKLRHRIRALLRRAH
jgi:hypothetical protein